jgi:hypothetical protein
MQQNEQIELDELISPEEREHLLFGLHRFLVWVGEPLPEKVEVNGKDIEIHDLIWDCIHKKDLSENEKKRFMEIIHMLEAKEKLNEELLRNASLTREEARKLFHESAALIRSIMDIKECESGNVKLETRDKELRQKINDAKKWIGFLNSVGKKVV